MRRAHTVQPLRTRCLFRADDRAYAVGENLRAAARERGEPRRLQTTENVTDTRLLRLGKVHDLHGRERLDVRMGQCRVYLPHHVLIVGKGTVWVEGAHDVNLRQMRRLLCRREHARHIIRFHNIAARIPLLHLKGAEGAVRTAYIREIDVTVHRIVDILPARALLRRTRPLCEREQVVVLIEEECILPRQPRPALGGDTGRSQIAHVLSF